jgi:hypothetical protein
MVYVDFSPVLSSPAARTENPSRNTSVSASFTYAVAWIAQQHEKEMVSVQCCLLWTAKKVPVLPHRFSTLDDQ